MIEAKRKIERRIAKPRALGVKEHRAALPQQDIFWADVAVHDAGLRSRRARSERLERRCNVGMHACGRQQVRLQPESVEQLIGVEFARSTWHGRKCPMDVRQVATDGGCRLGTRQHRVRDAPSRLRTRREADTPLQTPQAQDLTRAPSAPHRGSCWRPASATQLPWHFS